jgi:thiol-disulfide isomerase/thioredoxin
MIKHFALFAAVITTLLACSNSDSGSAPPIDAALMSMPLFSLDDRPAFLAQYRGKPLVINFWARWCDPCRREIPDLIVARDRFRPRGLEVVGVALESDPAAVRKFAAELGISYPILLAKDNGFALLQAMGDAQGGLPYTVVLDGDGHIRARKLGALSHEEINTAFESALN